MVYEEYGRWWIVGGDGVPAPFRLSVKEQAKLVRRGYRVDLFRPTDRWYWVDTGYACGAVVVDPEVDCITDCARIFVRRWIGRTWEEFLDEHPSAKVRRMKDGPVEALE